MSDVRCEWLQPVIVVPNVKETVAFYTDKLGFEAEFLWGEPPTHAGIKFDGKTIQLSEGKAVPHGVRLYLAVWDAPKLLREYRAAGVEVVEELADKPWGQREFVVKDNNGLLLCIGQPIPPEKIIIERETFEARLETRLLRVIREVAASKDMTLGEMLEETLLHSFEAMPDGNVANPHTQETHALIEQLRRKHEMHFDGHASYSFSESSESQAKSPAKLGLYQPILIVSDVAETVQFYQEKLGFRHLYPEQADAFLAADFAIVERDEVIFMFKAFEGGAPRPNPTVHEWATHDAFIFVKDPDALCEEFKARGVEIVKEVGDSDSSTHDFHFRDNNGYVFSCGHPTRA